jgi:adenine-specific DNA-methyltransferase
LPTRLLHDHDARPANDHRATRKKEDKSGPLQLPLFEAERKEPLRHAIEFYRHAKGWSNRLVAGDSLLVMNSLLEKEGMAGQVQMIYIDPPYGIKIRLQFPSLS